MSENNGGPSLEEVDPELLGDIIAQVLGETEGISARSFIEDETAAGGVPADWVGRDFGPGDVVDLDEAGGLPTEEFLALSQEELGRGTEPKKKGAVDIRMLPKKKDGR